MGFFCSIQSSGAAINLSPHSPVLGARKKNNFFCFNTGHREMLAFRRCFTFEDEDSGGGGEEGREKGYYHIRKAELAESVGGRKDRTV